MHELPRHIREFWAQRLGQEKRDGKSVPAVNASTGLWSKVLVGWFEVETNSMIPYTRASQGIERTQTSDLSC